MGKKQKKDRTKRGLILLLVVAAAAVLIALFVGGNRSVQEPESPNVEVIERADVSYERWLAAGMVTAISMQYPAFEINAIYLESETEMSDKISSAGATVVFSSSGESYAVQSRPLSDERTETGTIDLYTKDLGFATFDPIDPASVDSTDKIQVEIEELDELISQSILVSLYEH